MASLCLRCLCNDDVVIICCCALSPYAVTHDAQAFLDVTEALERCHMTVGANQRTAFSLCALTSSSDGCKSPAHAPFVLLLLLNAPSLVPSAPPPHSTRGYRTGDATTVSEMVLDAELCILSAASPCTCRGQVDDIFGHIADCASAHGNASRAVMPNDVDFPPFAEICDGDFGKDPMSVSVHVPHSGTSNMATPPSCRPLLQCPLPPPCTTWCAPSVSSLLAAPAARPPLQPTVVLLLPRTRPSLRAGVTSAPGRAVLAA